MNTPLREVVADALLPCPFCGLDVTDDEGCFPLNNARSMWEVRCGNPSCFAHEATDASREAAITRWNRRATPSPSPGVEAMLDRIEAPTGQPPRKWTEQEKLDCAAAMQKIVARESAGVEERARELLAAEYERSNCPSVAEMVRSRPFDEFDTRHQVSLDAIAAALRTPAKTEGDMVLALEWVREQTEGCAGRMQHLPAIEEAIVAYDPERMARCGNTVSKTGQRVVDARTLYIDLDGVMADFDGSFPAVFGLDHRDLADDEMWLHINGHSSFFRDLPPMVGAVEFFRSVEHLNPVILTACPKSNYPHVAAQKRAWVREHLSTSCLVLPVLGGRHKPLFMHQAGDILIDDFGKNCAAWESAGGVAIKHEGDWQATSASINAALSDAGNGGGHG